MEKKYEVYQVDSFTKEKFKGNPAGVVMNADGLTEKEMQMIGRELNNSETAFILSPEGEDHDLYIRYFTPTKEVPICGHATIAAHYIRAVKEDLDSCVLRQKSGVGILPVEIIEDEGDYKIIMTQGAIEFGAIIEGEEKKTLLEGLGIHDQDLMPHCPIQIVSTGHSKVMIPLKEGAKLKQLPKDYGKLSQLSSVIGCNGYFVFTLNVDDQECLTDGRMFAPAIGINEDPVTGNANGPLGAYLIRYNMVKISGNSFRFIARQGVDMGRMGHIEVEVEIKDGEPRKVKIAGSAVEVFKTTICV